MTGGTPVPPIDVTPASTTVLVAIGLSSPRDANTATTAAIAMSTTVAAAIGVRLWPHVDGLRCISVGSVPSPTAAASKRLFSMDADGERAMDCVDSAVSSGKPAFGPDEDPVAKRA